VSTRDAERETERDWLDWLDWPDWRASPRTEYDRDWRIPPWDEYEREKLMIQQTLPLDMYEPAVRELVERLGI